MTKLIKILLGNRKVSLISSCFRFVLSFIEVYENEKFCCCKWQQRFFRFLMCNFERFFSSKHICLILKFNTLEIILRSTSDNDPVFFGTSVISQLMEFTIQIQYVDEIHIERNPITVSCNKLHTTGFVISTKESSSQFSKNTANFGNAVIWFLLYILSPTQTLWSKYRNIFLL